MAQQRPFPSRPGDPGDRSGDALLRDYLDGVAVIQDDRIQKRLLSQLIQGYVALEQRVDGLLKNTLPASVVDEIKDSGRFSPRACHCTILFSDIVGFTALAEHLSGESLIGLLDGLIQGMDDLVLAFGGTKVKTIGDAYMAVFGAPQPREGHAIMAVRTGLAFLCLTEELSRQRGQRLQLRIGVHTGTVMAGVVGKERMQFDVFGDHVNIASRFESAGLPGRVNVSHETFLHCGDRFAFEPRGEIALKNKANMKAYLVGEEKPCNR